MLTAPIQTTSGKSPASPNNHASQPSTTQLSVEMEEINSGAVGQEEELEAQGQHVNQEENEGGEASDDISVDTDEEGNKRVEWTPYAFLFLLTACKSASDLTP